MKIVVVSAIMVDYRGRFLMARKKQRGVYCHPGGKVECGELLEAALAREVEEEVGVRIDVASLDFIGFIDCKDKVVFFYYVRTWVGKIKNMEPDKHGEWDFIDMPHDSMLVEGCRKFKSELLRNYEEIRYVHTSA